MSGLSNENIATTRTGVNAAVATVAVWAIAKLTGWQAEINDPVFIAVMAAGVPIVHRISTVLVELWPPLGFILFGVRTTPVYPNAFPPPPPPA